MASSVIKSYSKLSGALFGQFRKGKQLVYNHPLDTNQDQYFKIIQRILIPECMDSASEIPNYPQRIQKLLVYILPCFSYAVNFNVELIYRIVSEKDHQTPENMTKTYLLRAIMDLVFSSGIIIDDFLDEAELRYGKKSWIKACPGGKKAAINDGILVSFFPFMILQKHFKNDPGYVGMMEAIALCFLKLTMGQTLDVLGQGTNISHSRDDYNICVDHKNGHVFALSATLALLHAGISSEDIIGNVRKIFFIFAECFQIWDDFNDYYSNSELTGKPTNDLPNGTTTWASVTAMERFSASQAQEFKECYGYKDPVKIERVRRLYDDINMPLLYTEEITGKTKICKEMINQLPHPKLREACLSYLEWLSGQEILDSC